MTTPGRPRSDADDSLSDVPTRRIAAPPLVTVQVEGQTHPGRVRSGNEDALAVESPASERARALGTLLVVSDGMGGHAAGEVASRIVVDTIPDVYYRQAAPGRARPVVEALANAVVEANAAIFAEAQRNPERAGMGCTVVAAVVRGDDLVVAHVGDSRAYLVRGGRIRRLTRDHSWVAQQVDEGILTPEQAERHPHRSLLTRALGRDASVEVEVTRFALQVGDTLILCSDGLTATVRDAEIADLAATLPPAAATER
jgi:protein phosphatase